MEYPFVPRSTAHLRPGQFWAVPLADGRFACGRVLEVPREPDPHLPVSTRIFLAALSSWIGATPPTADDIVGASVVHRGFAHIKAITLTGGSILGERSLEQDGITPALWLTSTDVRQAMVYRGSKPMRRATPADAGLPPMRTWGYAVITRLAEVEFAASHEGAR